MTNRKFHVRMRVSCFSFLVMWQFLFRQDDIYVPKSLVLTIWIKHCCGNCHLLLLPQLLTTTDQSSLTVNSTLRSGWGVFYMLFDWQWSYPLEFRIHTNRGACVFSRAHSTANGNLPCRWKERLARWQWQKWHLSFSDFWLRSVHFHQVLAPFLVAQSYQAGEMLDKWFRKMKEVARLDEGQYVWGAVTLVSEPVMTVGQIGMCEAHPASLNAFKVTGSFFWMQPLSTCWKWKLWCCHYRQRLLLRIGTLLQTNSIPCTIEEHKLFKKIWIHASRHR